MSVAASNRLLLTVLNSSKKFNHLIKPSVLVKQFSIASSIRFAVDKSSLKFTDKHEWISVKGNIGTVGITDYAQVHF
jgi:hypothetical protein